MHLSAQLLWPLLFPSGSPSRPLPTCFAPKHWELDCQQSCTVLQAIKDAEADECIADQLAALQLTLSQLADQEGVGDTAEAGTHADATTTAGPDSQVVLCDVTGHDGMHMSRAANQPLLASCASTTHNILTAVIVCASQGGRKGGGGGS